MQSLTFTIFWYSNLNTLTWVTLTWVKLLFIILDSEISMCSNREKVYSST